MIRPYILLVFVVFLLAVLALPLSAQQVILASNLEDSTFSWSTIYSVGESIVMVAHTEIVGTPTRAMYFSRSDNAGYTWDQAMIEEGRFTSSGEIRSLNGDMVFMSYYDQVNGALKFATSSDGGETWETQVIDWGITCTREGDDVQGVNFGSIGSEGFTECVDADVGHPSSLYLSDSGKIFITYYDSTNEDLKLARSFDGGRTWLISILDSNGNLVGVENKIRGVGNTLFVAYNERRDRDLRFAKSLDGGDTWVYTYLEEGYEQTTGDKLDLEILDENNIFISHVTYRLGFYNEGIPEIVTSSNGGEAWNTNSLDTEMAFLGPTRLSVFDDGTIYVLMFRSPDGNVIKDYQLYSSLDFGDTWGSRVVGQTRWINGYDFYVPTQETFFLTHRFVAGSRYEGIQFMSSFDSGQTWNQLPPGIISTDVDLSPGFTMINIPVDDPSMMMASDLGVDAVYDWTGTGWNVYMSGINDFALESNTGYFVYVTEPTIIPFTGTTRLSTTLDFNQGFTLAGFHRDDVTAQDVFDATDATVVYIWNGVGWDIATPTFNTGMMGSAMFVYSPIAATDVTIT
jgi:hypothetical protein